MQTVGLFTRQEVKAGGGRKRAALSDLPDERLHALGLRAVDNMNPLAESPHMEPEGPDDAPVYVLGTAPGRDEDRLGRPIAGRARDLVLSSLGQARRAARLNNVVRTMPKRRRSVVLTREEIEGYRPSLVEDIERTRPRVLITLGSVPLRWCIGGTDTVEVCRGRQFPMRIGGHDVWVCPTFAPDYLFEKTAGRKRPESDALWRAYLRDVQAAVRLARSGPDPEPMADDEESLTEGVECYGHKPGQFRACLRALKALEDEPVVACDTETDPLRPYAADARLCSIGLGTFDRVVSVAWDHPESCWTAAERHELFVAVKRVLRRARRLVFHNAAFDLEWLARTFGRWILDRRGVHCTMQQAYVLDNRQHASRSDPRAAGYALDFVVLQYAGFRLKEHAGVDRRAVSRAPLLPVLRYMGRDVKWTAFVYEKQSGRIGEAKPLGRAYQLQRDRIPVFVNAQLEGLDVNQETVAGVRRLFEARREGPVKVLKGSRAVREYERKYGAFSYAAPDDVARLFGEVMGRKLERTKGGQKFSVDEASLKKIGGPEAEAVLALRKADKMISTYIDPLDLSNPATVLYPDGKIHTTFNLNRTSTGRLSSEGPNLQNFPKRDEERKVIREAIEAPPGYVIFSVDYGAIEARGFGMATRDKRLVASLWDDFDIHLYWAKRFAELYPKVILSRHGDPSDAKALKAYRGDIKNQWTFPSFYGASSKSISGYMEIPAEIIEPEHERFWREFRGVQRWQERTLKLLDSEGYVEALTGRRRQAPMTKNEALNMPIQGLASDIVVDAAVRLFRLRRARRMRALGVRINIHDDLTFIVPEKRLKRHAREIVLEMCRVPFRFVNVPILVEAEVGKNWCKMEKYGDFTSKELLGHTPKRPIWECS